MDGVDHILKHGETLRMGDRGFEVLHTPGHSSDSVCLYNKDHGDLFLGDTPVMIRSVDGAYENAFFQAMIKLCRRDIKTIYFGHGEPLVHNAQDMLQTSLRNVRKSMKNCKNRNDSYSP